MLNFFLCVLCSILISHIHIHIYTEHSNETPLERQVRTKKIELNQWHQQFWKDNNQRFINEKYSFEQKIKLETGKPTVTAEELSVFYKDFLNKNYNNHLQYNRQWWRENFGLLLPSLKLVFEKFLTKDQTRK